MGLKRDRIKKEKEIKPMIKKTNEIDRVNLQDKVDIVEIALEDDNKDENVKKEVVEEFIEEPIKTPLEPSYGVIDISNDKEDIIVTDDMVICLETKKVYDDNKSASVDTGANASSIKRNCNGSAKSAGGFTWKYYKDYLKEKE